jgi:hypothetical protein
VAAYLDGRLLAEHRTDGSDLTLEHAWSLGTSGHLGLGTTREVTFHKLELVEVTGRGATTGHDWPDNLVVNGDFEASGSGRPAAAWVPGRNPERTTLETESGNRFLRIVNAVPKQSPSVGQRIELDPRWRWVTVRGRMRTTGVGFGPGSWHRPKIGITFDVGSASVGWNECQGWRDGPDWRTVSIVVNVPQGAQSMNIMPHFSESTGTADYDDVVVIPHPFDGGQFPGAAWVWFPEPGFDVSKGVPAGERYFRRTFTLPPGRQVTKAFVRVTADDGYVLSVNGREVLRGSTGESEFTKPRVIDLAPLLRPGRNVLAAAVTNRALAGHPVNSAGLLVYARVETKPAGGAAAEPDRSTIVTDPAWRTSADLTVGWQQPDFDDATWPAAAVVAPFGRGQWGASLNPARP